MADDLIAKYHMSDHFFKKFYDAVRDPTWPIAENYAEFVQLPERIQVECRSQHTLGDRCREMENVDYWRRHLSHSEVFRRGDVVYAPVHKCANSYYKRLLQKQEWQSCNLWDLDLTRLHAFGLIMHPLTRRLKGITQLLEMSFKNDCKIALEFITIPEHKEFFRSIAIMDAHSMPYSIVYGEKLRQIHWIPMELFSDRELKDQVISWCDRFGVEVVIPFDDARVNESSPEKKTLYNTVKDIFLNQYPADADSYLLFAEDLKFYRELIDQYV